MNWEILTDSKLIENLGWTLIYSIWQISFLAAGLFLILKFFKKLSSAARYLFSYAALILVFLLPLISFLSFNTHPAQLAPNKPTATETADFHRDRISPAENVYSSNGVNPSYGSPNNNDESFSLEDLQRIFQQKLVSALPILVWLWAVGIGFYTLRLLGGIWHVRAIRTKHISAPSGEWQQRFYLLREKFDISQKVEFRQSDSVKTPIVIGWLKPLILLPTSVFLQIDPRQLETILAHELVHIRRHDNLFNLLQSIIEILFFYHPGARWISAVVRREREFVCDDRVLEIMGSERMVYADALANLEELRLRANAKTPLMATAASGGNLMKRIERIIEKNAERQASSKQSFWSASLALLLISAVLINVFSARTALSVNPDTSAAGKKLAIGFVAIPPVDRSANPPKDSDATARLLIEKLKAHKIPAIGFLLGGAVSDGEKLYPVRANIARLWRDAGFEIGIGNFTHVWFYEKQYDEYVAGVEKNIGVAKKLLAEKNIPLRYFSYPFLNTGKNADERQRFEGWLKQQGITPVKYTIDNQEWMYSYAYDAARNDNDVNTMQQVRREFLSYMSKMFDHYEKYSQQMFGRDIAQTMVLTPSRLVADSSDELFGMIEQRGYQYVSMDEALKDEAYNTPENFYGKSGISWFDRWQMAKGEKLLDEPRVSQTVSNSWNNKKPSPPAPPKLIKFVVPPAPPKPSNPSAPPAPPKVVKKNTN